MKDAVFERFLTRQKKEGMALAAASDLLDLKPLDAQHFLARFHCRGLVRSSDGEAQVADRFDVGVWFPSDYLRRADPGQVLTWLGPRNVFHPNIAGRGAFICVGRMRPGTSLVDLLYQCYEIISYQKVTMREDDALNPGACAWARRNQGRLPVDARPLKRAASRIRADLPAGEAR